MKSKDIFERVAMSRVSGSFIAWLSKKNLPQEEAKEETKFEAKVEAGSTIIRPSARGCLWR